jgi:hypothetical protein
VTVGVPVAPRCTPLVTAASGTDLARPVAGGSDLLFPFSHTWPASASGRRGVKGALAPSREYRVSDTVGGRYVGEAT